MDKNNTVADPLPLFFKWYNAAGTGKGGALRKSRAISWGTRAIRRLAAAALPQSSIIQQRKDLKIKVDQFNRQYQGKPIPCPDTWGGYCLIPDTMEFWEGRINSTA